MALCGLHGGKQRPETNDVDDTLDVVGQHMQGHLGTDVLQCLLRGSTLFDTRRK